MSAIVAMAVEAGARLGLPLATLLCLAKRSEARCTVHLCRRSQQAKCMRIDTAVASYSLCWFYYPSSLCFTVISSS